MPILKISNMNPNYTPGKRRSKKKAEENEKEEKHSNE